MPYHWGLRSRFCRWGRCGHLHQPVRLLLTVQLLDSLRPLHFSRPWAAPSPSTNSFSTADGKSTVTIGTSCTGIPSGDAHNGPNGNTGGAGNKPNAIYFSYSSNESWDGISAVIGQYSASNRGGAANPCSSNFERPVATCPDDACTGFLTNNAPYVCQTIDIGTSDVEVSAIIQTSTGTLFGPLDPGTATITRGFTHAKALNVSGLPASGYSASLPSYSVKNPEQPIAYPFSFYVNPPNAATGSTGVVANQCASGSPLYAGFVCADDRNCGSYVATSYCDYTCCARTGPLTMPAAPALRSRIAAAWMVLPPTAVLDPNSSAAPHPRAMPVLPILRKRIAAVLTRRTLTANRPSPSPTSPGSRQWRSSAALSKTGASSAQLFPRTLLPFAFNMQAQGASATLDWGVMNGNGWGKHIYGFAENRASTGTPPYIYFNDGTSDLKNCMNWANGASFSGAVSFACSNRRRSRLHGFRQSQYR